MNFYERLFDKKNSGNNDSFFPVNISREVWFAFLNEFTQWNDKDIYAISFFIDFDYDNQQDIRLYFGYNTERHYQSERCHDVSDEEVRWNYEYWLQNELFCFGEDHFTEHMIDIWLRQQHIPESQTVERLTEHLIQAVRDIHQSKILSHRFGKEIPVIIHNLYYYPDIAMINMEANGDALDRDFIDYCMKCSESEYPKLIFHDGRNFGDISRNV